MLVFTCRNLKTDRSGRAMLKGRKAIILHCDEQADEDDLWVM